MNEQELLYIVLTPVVISLIIAILNFDFLNDLITNFHNWVVKSHENSKSGIGRFILSLFKYPGEIPQKIKHDGWRNGLTFLSSTLSISLTVSLIGGVAFITFYVVMAALVLGAIYVVLMIIGGSS
jgi:hypothetical protein